MGGGSQPTSSAALAPGGMSARMRYVLKKWLPALDDFRNYLITAA